MIIHDKAPVISWNPVSSECDLRDFMLLPEGIRDALVWATQQQDLGQPIGEREIASWMINQFDRDAKDSQKYGIGGLLNIMSNFIANPRRCEVVRFYVDRDCNMVLTKLSWSPDTR